MFWDRRREQRREQREARRSGGAGRGRRGAVLGAGMAAGLLLAVPAMFAQLNTATVQGTAKDQSGAVVPQATVTIRNVDTGVERTVTAGEGGEFSVPSLQPGMYDISVVHAGFQTTRQTGVKLAVGQALSVDLTLNAGSVSETVDVKTTAQSIEDTDATLGNVIEQKQVVDLPLNGRQFSQLIQLAPGVVPIDVSQNGGKAPNFGAGASTPSVNGQTNRSNLFFVDGIVDSNPFFGGFSFSPSVDDIQEFRAESHTDQAQFGQATGAIVSVVTRPGTNEFHGTVFEFVRNTILNTQIRNFAATPQKKLPYHQNQFGASVGGPVLRSKVFFFANYEGGRQVQPQPQLYTVPTDAERNGDFSGTLPGNVTKTIYDPATYNAATQTVQPFAGNVIPSGRINQGMLTFLNAIYPRANVTPNSSGTRNYYTSTANTNIADQGSLRLDYNLSDKNSFNGRYSQNEATINSPGGFNSLFSTGFNGKNAGGNWLHTFTPRLISDITVAYNSLNIPQSYLLPVDQDQLFTSAGLGAGFNARPGQTTQTVVPAINLNGASYDGFYNGAGPIGPMNILQVSGALTNVRGAHTLKFGGSYYHTAMYTNWAGNDFSFSYKGTWNTACQFSTAANAACPTYNANAGDLGGGGDPVASLLLSAPISATRYVGATGVNLRQDIYSAFAQDTWSVTPKLTINYGVRWDFGTPVTERDNRLAVYNIYTQKYQIAKGDVDLPTTPLPANVVVSDRRSIASPVYTYVQPRLGIAYQASPTTTFRAGAGRSVDVWGLPLQVAQQNRGAWPSGVAQIASNQQLNIAGYSLKPDGSRVTGQNPFTGDPVLPASPLPAGGAGFQDVKWQSASSWQWNAEVQQDLSKLGALRVGYVGSQTSHLTIAYPYNLATASTNPNRVYPDQIFGSPGTALQSIASANYHSLQTQLSRSFANGLVYNFTFTWSKALGLAQCGDFYNGCVQNPYNLRADYGRTALDIPYVTTFNLAYELPFGRSKPFLTHGIGSALAGGWQVNTIVTSRSGTVINPTNGANGDTANAGGGNQRISYVGDPNRNAPKTIQSWFNPTAFALPANGTYGNAAINSLRGPGYWNADLSLFRDIPIYERVKLQFRAEAFDVFNHPNYSNPSSSYAGFTGSTNNGGALQYNNGFNVINSTLPNSNRVIQLAGKLLF